jgi:hypothetical protein
MQALSICDLNPRSAAFWRGSELFEMKFVESRQRSCVWGLSTREFCPCSQSWSSFAQNENLRQKSSCSTLLTDNLTPVVPLRQLVQDGPQKPPLPATKPESAQGRVQTPGFYFPRERESAPKKRTGTHHICAKRLARRESGKLEVRKSMETAPRKNQSIRR